MTLLIDINLVRLYYLCIIWYNRTTIKGLRFAEYSISKDEGKRGLHDQPKFSFKEYLI